MKNKTKLKAFMLSVAMAVAMSLPMTTNAQDFFIRNGNDNNDNRGGESGVVWNNPQVQNPSEPAPLGSGLLILVAAGAGYVALKKKED